MTVGYRIGIYYHRRQRFLRRTKRINPAAESSDRFPAFRMEPRSASWLNPYTMISYVPVWKLSARRYRGYHFPRWYVSSSGTSRRLEIIEVRRGIGHLIDYARCHWLGRARKRSCQKTRPQRREVWNQSDGTLSSVKKEGKRGKNRGKKGLAPWNDKVRIHLMAAIISARNDVGLSSRQASISNWNLNCKCTHWKSTLNLLSEGDDGRGCTRRGTEAFDCTRLIKVLVWKRRATATPSLYLLNIDQRKFADRASRDREYGSLIVVHYRSLPMTCVNPASKRLQLSLYV